MTSPKKKKSRTSKGAEARFEGSLTLQDWFPTWTGCRSQGDGSDQGCHRNIPVEEHADEVNVALTYLEKNKDSKKLTSNEC